MQERLQIMPALKLFQRQNTYNHLYDLYLVESWNHYVLNTGDIADITG